MGPDQRRTLTLQMARLADGDRSVLDAVMGQLGPVVRRFAYGLLGQDADAEDAAQEALVKIFARMADFDPGRDGLTWALTIASFEVRTLRKRHRRRREVSDEDLVAAKDEQPDPEALLEARSLEAALAEAVGELSTADQEVLAQWLDRGEGVVAGVAERKRKQRALERLKAIWRNIHGFTVFR